MSKASQSQQLIASQFNNKPILYVSGLGILLGVNEALILSQLLYWRGKGFNKQNWVFKTHDEMYLETGLSRDKQDRAIKHLKNLGVLKTRNAGVPQKRHFLVELEVLLKVVSSLLETHKLKTLKASSSTVDNPQTITKTTQSSTAENTLYSPITQNPTTNQVFESIYYQHINPINDDGFEDEILF